MKKIVFLVLIFASLILLKSATSAADDPLLTAEIQVEQTDLQKQLAEIEKEISQLTRDIKTVQGQKKTLQNKIYQLQKQQNLLNLQINSTSIQILDLKGQITKSEMDIEINAARVEKLKKSLEQLLVLLFKSDNYSFLYPFLGTDKFSDMFIEKENYLKISEAIGELLAQLRAANDQLANSKKSLEVKEDSSKNLLQIQKLQTVELAGSVSEKNTLLKETKGKESNYQVMLTTSQQKAKAIRERLYQLLEVEKQINFGQAVQIAEWASSHTGVRPAFLLSVLTQESNLGRNVGTCNRAGDPPSKSYKEIMHPTRDQPPFLTITKEIGLNPDATPVSCPMRDKKGKRIGWGGAMGPAQFIPSTWMGYRGKVTAITGKPANPWDIRDAFLASAIKLAHDGAKTEAGEWAAAMRYFSGGTNTKYRFYGDSVVSRADKYQEDIDELNK